MKDWTIVVQEWMTEYGFSANEALVFATIWGFSQQGEGCYYGSRQQLAKRAFTSIRTVDRILKEFLDRGLIVREEHYRNGMPFITYTTSDKFAHPVQILHGGSDKIAHIENKDNIIDNSKLKASNNSNSNILNLQEKEIKKEKEVPLIDILPYHSDAFISAWKDLLSQPKWKNKTTHALKLSAKSLAPYSEEFCIKLMNEAIERNYQGLVFDNTARRYEEWKNGGRKSSSTAVFDDPEQYWK